MGWLMGKKWEGKGEAQGEFPASKFTTQERFRWVVNGQCVEQRWVMKDGEGKAMLSGLIIYGLDCGEKKIKAWSFGGSGDVGHMVLESCEAGKLVWKGRNAAFEDGFAGEFTYTQKSDAGEYHIDFQSNALTAKQTLKAVPGAQFSFENTPDSKPNDQISNWGRYMVGGTWTTTMEGERLEHPYRWILNKNFLYNPRTGGPYPGLAIFGYDPVSSKLTFWHFEDSGLIGHSTITKETDSVWKLVGGGYAPDGKHSWTSTLVRQGKGRLTEKDIKLTVADKTRTEPDGVWVKEPAKKK